MTTKSAAAKKAPAKKTAHKTAAKAPAKKTAAKKTTAKKTAKSTAKKTTAPRPRGEVDVKMIHTIDSAPGRDTRVYFTDGSNAVVKRDSALDKMLSRSETHAPGMVKVSVDHGQITGAEPVKVDQATPDETDDTSENADSAS